MIEVPMFVWVSVTLYILTSCLKQLGSIATSAKMLNMMDNMKKEEGQSE
jgi:hypothetical protein